MSTADDDYKERLEDLFDDMESDGVDPIRMLMSAVASHVEGALEAEEGDAYVYQFEDINMVIVLEPIDEEPAARMH